MTATSFHIVAGPVFASHSLAGPLLPAELVGERDALAEADHEARLQVSKLRVASLIAEAWFREDGGPYPLGELHRVV